MNIRKDGLLWEVYLSDDGTMDTVLTVQPVKPRKRLRNQDAEYYPVQEIRFSDTSDMRKPDGSFSDASFRELALDAIDGYEFDEEV